MADYSFTPKGVCARNISFSIEDGKIHDLSFLGGCNGNLKAIGKLLEGADPKSAADILRGNQCGMRGTSCADQLSIALDQAVAELGL